MFGKQAQQYRYERKRKRDDNLRLEASETEGIEVPLTKVRIPEGKADFRADIISSILHALFFMYIWVRMSRGQMEM